MTIYEKIATARVQFQDSKPKMSGKNTFAGYEYFELSDILPRINALGKELGFLCVVNFTDAAATLDVIDCEKDDGAVRFTSPMSKATLKGCHDVQNLGAVETYLKRYLYQNAFEIVESDALNGTQGRDDARPQAPAPRADVAALAKEAGKLAVELGLSQSEKDTIKATAGGDMARIVAAMKGMKSTRDKEGTYGK